MRENDYILDDKNLNLYQLLEDFFNYYKQFKLCDKVSINRHEILQREYYDEDFLFSIEDPFDIKHNPGDRPKGDPREK